MGSRQGHATPLFDSKEQAFSIREASGGHLYALAGAHPSTPFEAKLAIDIDNDWMGWAGLIFAVRDSDDSFPDKERLCYAVRFIKHKEGVPPVIRVDEITFSNTDSVEWQDSLTAQIDQVEVSEPLKGKAVLHVEVRDKKLLVRFDDQQLNGQDTWEPKLPSWRESWSPKGSFGLGITGKGNLALISHLQVDAIESDDP